MEIIEFIIGLW